MATINSINANSGSIIQQYRSVYTTQTSTSTSIAYSTTPTTGNTTLLTSVTFSPSDANNILIFDVAAVVMGSPGVGLFLFAGSTCVYGSGSCDATSSVRLKYYMTSGTTASTTYSVYYAVTNGSGTAYANQVFNGNSYGSSMASTLIVTEVVP